MLAQLKYGTSTSQNFWGCDESDTGGVLGVYVDGVLYTGDTLEAANDYTGIVTATGLSPGTHTWQMAIDGVAQDSAETFQTVPAPGENFKMIIIEDCTEDSQGFSTIMSENARFGISNGDHYYLDQDPSLSTNCSCTTLPTGASAVVYATVLESYRCRHRCHLTFGRLRPLAMRKHQWVLNWHNHEFEVQPFITTNDPGSGIKYQAAKKAADEYMFSGHNPASGSYDTYPNPRIYHDYTVGDVHVLMFDHTSYGFEPTAFSRFEGSVPDGAGGSNVGSQQLDWAIATIQASTSKFIFLVTPAEPVHISANAIVGGQWETLLAAVDAKDATIILFCGDSHQMLAELINGSSQLPNRPMLVINGSPLQHPSRSTASGSWDSAGDATIYVNDVTAPPASNIGNIDTEFNYNYTAISVNPNGTAENTNSHVKIEIKNALTGQVRWHCMVNEGERTPILPSSIARGVVR